MTIEENPMSAKHRAGELREIAPSVYAYLQKGSWGFSNAGLVADADGSLLVDTLYDVELTAEMLRAMRRATASADRVATVVNTHANGDHCWGNQLAGGARIISSRAAAAEMKELSPSRMAAMISGARLVSRSGSLGRRLLKTLERLGVRRASALADVADFVVENFGSFDFRNVSLTLPTETFTGKKELTVGPNPVELIEVGPAHTKGDVIVHLPDARVAFTGDILFIGTHPIIWEGPVENWIAACDRLLELDVDVIVPGHGPITDKQGVRRTKDYWQRLVDVTKRGRESGASVEEVVRELFAEAFDGWTEKSRIAVNIDTIYRELAGDRSHRNPLQLLGRMARLERNIA
jgi:glyoxylase-like metal-dependent hydrolase (beta-lactamase superfamily II)